MKIEPTDGWNEYKKLVLYEFEQLHDEIGQVEESQFRLRDEVKDNTIDITILKVKAGIWGAIAGGIVGIILSLLLNLISKGLGG